MTNPKGHIREKSIKMMHLSKLKINKIHELCIDKEPNVRIALYNKLKGQMRLLKLPEGKLYRFLTRGLSEFDPKAKQAFSDLLLSFCIKAPHEEVKIEKETEYNFNEPVESEEIPTISLNYDYKYEGSRKKQVKMTIFELFTKLKIHKTHYIDGFSVLPQKFMSFLFSTFERSDILKYVEATYKDIINVIVHKEKTKTISFSHFSFIRISMEYTKMILQNDLEGYDCIDPLIPDLEEWVTVFEYFIKKQVPRREELEILSEWSKYSLHMPYSIPSIHN